MTPSTATVTVPAKKIKLTADREFTRTDADGWALHCTVSAGQEVYYERLDTVTETIRIATYIDEVGDAWVSEVREPRQVKPVPVNGTAPTTSGESRPRPVQPAAPVVSAPPASAPSLATQHAMRATAEAAGMAASTLAARQTHAADSQERRVRRLERVNQILAGGISQLNYYIPDSLKKDYPNPSRIFRRHGIRLDGSNWLFPTAALQHDDVRAVLETWSSMLPIDLGTLTLDTPVKPRVRHWVTPLTREQLAPMRESAQEQLAEELREVHISLITRIDSAAERLREAREAVDATPGSNDRAEASHNAALRATIAEACERFGMCLRGAELFDDTGALDSLFCALKDAIRTQTLAVNATLRARRVKQVTLPSDIK